MFVFRYQITNAVHRLRKGKFFGQEFELGEELASLETSVSNLASEVRELPSDTAKDTSTTRDADFDAQIRPILLQAATSPRVALMTLSAELQKQSLYGLATRGLLRGRSAVAIKEALSELRQYGFPAAMEGSLELFESVRNKIIHGADATDDDALRALDSGMTILRTLAAMPREINTVYHPGVELFSDAGCTKLVPDAKGIILDVASPGGVTKRKVIFPTRAKFEKGKQVSWEWRLGSHWPKTWYRDPDTGAIRLAWDASTEFVGRHLGDIG
jgi:hypothetical protein